MNILYMYVYILELIRHVCDVVYVSLDAGRVVKVNAIKDL